MKFWDLVDLLEIVGFFGVIVWGLHRYFDIMFDTRRRDPWERAWPLVRIGWITALAMAVVIALILVQRLVGA